MKKHLIILALLGMLAQSCEKKSDNNQENQTPQVTLNAETLELHYDEQMTLVASTTPSDMHVQWSTENVEVATVNTSGEVSGKHIGTTEIIARGSGLEARCEVNIKPYYELYQDPILDFTKNLYYIKTNETRTLLEEEPGASLLFEGENDTVNFVLYIFEFQLLELAGVYLDSMYSEELYVFIRERYEFADFYNGVGLYVKGDLGILLGDSAIGPLVVYIDISSFKSGKTNDELIDIFNIFKSRRKV